jgi:hypothetical protein
VQDTLSIRFVPESSVSFDASAGICYQCRPSPEGATPIDLDSLSIQAIGSSPKLARLSQIGT